MNFKIRRYLIRRPLVIGRIDIEVNVSDNESGINRVEFYINSDLRENITDPPYTYTWTKEPLITRLLRIRHLYCIKVIAYDNGGNSASDEIIVRKFL